MSAANGKVSGAGSADVKVEAPKVEPKKPEAVPAEPVADPNDPANQPKTWHVKGSLGVGAGTNGYNDSYIFPGAFGKFGDHILTHLDIAAGHDLTGGKFRLRLMGQANLDLWRGNESTKGASLNLISIGPRLEADWRRAIPWENFGIFSRVGIDLGLGVGWGTAPFETITLHNQPATFGMGMGIDLNVINFQIPQMNSLEWGLDFMYRTTVIDGPVANSAANFVGGMLTLRPGVTRKPEKVEVPKPIKVCSSLKDLIEKLRKDIHGDGETPGLAARVKDYEAKVAEKRELLKTRGVDPLDDAGVLTVLRDQRASELSQKELVGLDPKKDEAKIKEIKAKAAIKAEADFPNVEAFWNPTPHSISDKDLEIPNPLPTDCDELDKLFKIVDKNKEDLNARVEQLKKVYDAPFPPRIREIVSKVVDVVRPNLKKIHFENDKPNPAELTAAIKAIQANKAKNGGKIDWNDGKLVTTLRPIFDNTKTGTQYTNEVIKIIKETSAALNGDLMKEVKGMEIQGHTSLAGTDASNMTLSDRRAQLIKEMLEGSGVGEEGVTPGRLTAKGYGETRPLHPDEETFPKNSAERASKAGENRRIELIVPDTEITRIEALGGVAPGLDKSVPKKDDKKDAPKKDEKKAPEPKKDDSPLKFPKK